MNTHEGAVVKFAQGLPMYRITEIRRGIVNAFGDSPESEIMSNPNKDAEMKSLARLLQVSVLEFKDILSVVLPEKQRVRFEKAFNKLNTDEEKAKALIEVLFHMSYDGYSRQKGDEARSNIQRFKEQIKSMPISAIPALLAALVAAYVEGVDFTNYEHLTELIKKHKVSIGVGFGSAAIIAGYYWLRIRNFKGDFSEARRQFPSEDPKSDLLRYTRWAFDNKRIQGELNAFIALMNTYLDLATRYPSYFGKFKLNMPELFSDNADIV